MIFIHHKGFIELFSIILSEKLIQENEVIEVGDDNSEDQAEEINEEWWIH